MHGLLHALFIGIGATALMDAWGVARQPLFGFARLDVAMIGRWAGHMPRGRFRHQAIARATPIRGERLIGWTMHYLIGVSFAGLLLATAGMEWLLRPTLLPALLIGVGTVAAPMLLMQPGMGMGIAASRTAHPNTNRVQSLLTHTIYGVGLYLAGWLDHLLFVALDGPRP